ncbi:MULTISPECIES: hypothetical protein [Methylorubrum]|uniref:Uncharacterized protein n=1 Tax=Methylorubrum thiocyanatum TaxID=47958 RepID=A0AA40RXW9_9HYPH|nr:hypothetical protein [Methylorubrum thiocyanatum]MBA8910971.1 hypothetical protein [Methylorubrum thiocyanatum]GJE83395.1 hypothetical protein CJNNKLLH_4768 [Methylorubrum thiocyanatum]
MTDVYRNLTRQVWSVREGGRVVAHLHELALRDVRLVVQPGGRAACLRTGQRSAQAVARGTRTDFAGVPEGAVEIGYSPWMAPYFTFRPGFRKALACRVAVFTSNGTAWALL